MIAYLERGRVRLETRAGNDATRCFAPIAELVARLPARSAILDGEIAVPDERGVTHIALLDQALRGRGVLSPFTCSTCCTGTAGICVLAPSSIARRPWPSS